MTDTPVKSYAESNRVIVEAFARWLLVKNYSKYTRREYPRTIQKFCAFLGAEDATAANLGTIRNFLVTHGKTPAVFQGYRVALRAFYRFLTLAHVIQSSPASVIRRPKLRRSLPRCLTEKEVGQLIAVADSPRALALLELLYASGLRASEVANLQIKDLNLDSGTLMVRRGKGDKDRLGMVGSKAVEALRAHLGSRKRGFVFPNRRGGRLSTSAILGIVTDASRLAGLYDVHTHTLRHTFATVLRNRGVDIRHIQELMGHVRVSTTAIYLHTAIADLAKVIERCHPHSKGENDVKE